MSQFIAELDYTQPWAQISCVFGESLMPPSTFDAFVKHTNIRKQIGLSELAIVIKDTDIHLTIEAQLSQAYTQCEVTHRFYATIEDAIDAIHPHYKCDVEELHQFFQNNNFASQPDS
ncbi:hypothetical protein QTP81_02000 [Alteromonas sp. ASW11-36]|uniref:Uncharacterized protein n=1 Tax=Alteromonas arenosi TaxID=3055817 RepID=A0ABT7ST51_9ALTE|nr:hypothetical protein [Alteromonas sp. ASW11-36]MDM7859377.1 hypothetical protein [Alteromonas sp. ASW11-36]